MTSGDPAAIQAQAVVAAKRAIAVAWHDLTLASFALTNAVNSDDGNVHSHERLEGALRAAAVAYAAAVDACHAAASSHRAAPVRRGPVVPGSRRRR